MTTSTPQAGSPLPHTPSRTDFSLVRRAALRTIGRLQGGYRQDVPSAVAAVARLRREAGRDPHASPAGWGLDDLADLAELREDALEEEQERLAGQATPDLFSGSEKRKIEQRREREDRAVHLAVTLWALHQQSIRDDPMHEANWTLGRAARRLAHGKTGTRDTGSGEESQSEQPDDRAAEPVEDAREAIRKRFVRIGTSTDFDILSGRLRQMVLLLRTARIPLDYGRLTDQVWRWQNEYQQDDVRRAWGREFHLPHE